MDQYTDAEGNQDKICKVPPRTNGVHASKGNTWKQISEMKRMKLINGVLKWLNRDLKVLPGRRIEP
jgi:hypothetical protein